MLKSLFALSRENWLSQCDIAKQFSAHYIIYIFNPRRRRKGCGNFLRPRATERGASTMSAFAKTKKFAIPNCQPSRHERVKCFFPPNTSRPQNSKQGGEIPSLCERRRNKLFLLSLPAPISKTITFLRAGGWK